MHDSRCKKNFTSNLFLLLASCLLVLFSGAANPSWAAVANTKHNLSASGPGPIKALSGSDICSFCHTPHHSNSSGSLWNKETPATTYQPYASSTTIAAPGQPYGSSRLCLSCHDGTIAIGSLLNLPGFALEGVVPLTDSGSGALTAEGKLSPSSLSFLGVDLKDDHPVSFSYAQTFAFSSEYIDPGDVKQTPVSLEDGIQVQCTSCHDPHFNTYQKFLVMDYGIGAPLCTTCHNKDYWDTAPSIHNEENIKTWNGLGQNPWHLDLGLSGYGDDTLNMHGCYSCHSSHKGAAGMMLLKGENPGDPAEKGEEWTCLSCHNGNFASKDIESELFGISSHPVMSTYNAHKPERLPTSRDPIREDPLNLSDSNRHSECQDCHNPHATKSGNHTEGSNIIGNNLLGSWGVMPVWSISGDPATEYIEIDFSDTGIDKFEGYLCLKCHSYYAYGLTPPSVPSGNADGSYVTESDLSSDFNPGIHSFHPVFSQGANQPPLDANINWPANGLGLTNTFMYVEDAVLYPVRHDSLITCTDCHEPHGSDNKWLLKSNETGSGTFENFCYNCHRRDVYGDEEYDPPSGNYSRVTHPVDGNTASTSPFYVSGIDTGNNSNKWENLCLSCHGGGYDSTDDRIEGIHGSNMAIGSFGLGNDEIGYRLMNGAAVLGITRAQKSDGFCSSTDPVELWLKTDITDPLFTDPVNNYDWSIAYGYYLGDTNSPAYFLGRNANYCCDDIIGCTY